MIAVAEARECEAQEPEEHAEVQAGAYPAWLFPTLLAVVLAGAFVLRIWGIRMGLPSLLHPDEWRIVNPALAMGGTLDLNPHQFDVGSGMMYLCLTLFGIYFGLGHLLGVFPTVEDFGISFFVDPTPFYLIARGTSVFFGLAAVYVAYLIGKRLLDRWAGIGAALLVAVHPEHVTRSHFAYPDPMMVFFILIAIYVMVAERQDRPSFRTDVLVGLLLGIAGGAKSLAVFAVPGYVVWRLLDARAWGAAKRSLAVVVGGAACCAGLFVTSPYLFLDWGTARYQMFGGIDADGAAASGGDVGGANLEAIQNLQGSALTERRETASRMLSHIVGPEGLAVAGTLAALVGLVWAASRRPALVVAFVVAATVNAAFFILNIRYMQRWMFPAVTWLWVFGGVGSAVVLSKLSSRTGTAWRPIAGVLLSATLVIVPLSDALGRAADIAADDTRVTARQWIEGNIPDGSTIVLDGPRYMVPQVQEAPSSISSRIASLPPTLKPPFTYLDQYYRFQLLAAQARTGPQYTILRIKHRGDLPEDVNPQDLGNPVAPDYVLDGSFTGFAQEGVDYAVTHETSLRRGLKSTSLNARRFYSDLVACGEIIHRIVPEPGQSGPAFLIFRCTGNATSARNTRSDGSGQS